MFNSVIRNVAQCCFSAKICHQKRKKDVTRHLMVISGLIISLLAFSSSFAQKPIEVTGQERGLNSKDAFTIWQDPSAEAELSDALQAQADGKFQLMKTKGSTGFKEGAVWSHFYLKNITDKEVTLQLEYIDHQLISLDAYQKASIDEHAYKRVSNLSLSRPFEHRQIPHNRFVFEVKIDANTTTQLFVKFSSDGKGFIFPNLRIWQPQNLRQTQSFETAMMAFFLGGFLLMSIFALVVGLATKERSYLAYAGYAITKMVSWATVLGYTHQFFITENFHWSYIHLSAAITIFTGVWFARIFLQTPKYLPRLDYVLILMLINALFLFFCALYKLTVLSILSTTLALLLYPVLSIAGIIRWNQGSRDAALFAIAWTFLVVGLFVLALRDLGLIEHNIFNYYWPPFASYTEMVVILVAMWLKVRRLGKEKELAELRYLQHLEQSKAQLETQVQERTRDLEQAKLTAEKEARTDSLTNIYNRRYFMKSGEDLLNKVRNRNIPYSVLMFDIDHFKSINDQYGHPVGDQALREFAHVIQEGIRESDIFGRLGGEEFALIVNNNQNETLQTAERLRENISKIKIDTHKGLLSFTTSVGIAHLTNEDTVSELINSADKALYRAKKTGRNKVVEACEATLPGTEPSV